MFYGRNFELESLKDFYNSQGKVACIFGRKGIGKTALIKEFIKDKPHLYFAAYATTGYQAVSLMARSLGVFEEINSRASSLENLHTILGKVKAPSEEEPLIFVIDNYPAFARAEAGFDKALFDYVNSSAGIKFIFAGDSYLSMEKLFFEKKSLWKDSLDLSFELKALGFFEAKNFLSEVSDPTEKATLYGICGGIPSLLAKGSAGLAHMLEDFFFGGSESSLLPDNLMQTELRELSYYNHILTALAEGNNRVNQISGCVDKPKDVVVPYMNTLMSIGFVTKENPITEKSNRKKTRYSIINSFDLFWYKFFAPNMDLYYAGDRAVLMDRVIGPGLPAYMETVFISMCKEYLQKATSEGKYPFTVREIGNWWQNDDEKMTTQGFDLVAMGDMEDDEAMVFARCYYNDEPVGIATLKELIDLTKQVKGKKNVFYLVFSKSGFHENTTTVAATIKNIILISLGDIVNG